MAAMCHRLAAFGLLLAASSMLAGAAHADEIKAEFLKNGRQTITVRPEQPGKLLVVNPTIHRFKCDHLTEGLRVVVTPAEDIDVTLQVENRKPIDGGGGGKAERYVGHPPLGGTTFHIQAKAGEGEVVVAWTWDPRCCEKCKTDVPGGRRGADNVVPLRQR